MKGSTIKFSVLSVPDCFDIKKNKYRKLFDDGFNLTTRCAVRKYMSHLVNLDEIFLMSLEAKRGTPPNTPMS